MLGRIKRTKYKLIIAVLLIPITMVVIVNLATFGEDYNTHLARSFIKLSLNFTQMPRVTEDLSFFRGKYFWPLGPFPAIILVPGVFLYSLSSENILKIVLTAVNFFLVYKIAIKLGLEKYKSVLVAVFFIFGSVYAGLILIPISVYFTQIVATTCLLLALNEFLNSKRALLIGLFLALAALSRPTLFTAFIFPALIFKGPKNLLLLAIPAAAALAMTLAYNQARFGNITEFGYTYQLIPQILIDRRDAWGAFSPKHIPGNLIHMLVNFPQVVTEEKVHLLKFPYLRPDFYGMSIFLTSPLLLLLYKSNFKDKLVKTAFITCLVIFLPVSLYYSYGWAQTGYRYSLDFLPFLLIPLATAIRKESVKKVEILTIAGIAITWFFAVQHFSIIFSGNYQYLRN